MIVETSGGRHKCASAEQHIDGVHLLDETGNVLLIIKTPNDIISVEGGEIVVVEQPDTATADDVLNAMLGVTV